MTPRSYRSFSISFLLLAAIATVGCCRTTSAAVLTYEAETVAGIDGQIGTINGPPGVSMLNTPQALCFGSTDDEVLIGQKAYFRIFSSQTRETTTLFGTGITGTTDGWDTAQVNYPRGCARAILPGGGRITYFVEGGSDLRYFTSNIVVTLRLGVNLSFTAVAVDPTAAPNTAATALYITEQTSNSLWGCGIDNVGVPVNCRSLSGFSAPIARYAAVVVTTQGVFVASAPPGISGIAWFTTAGTLVTTYTGSVVDIAALPNGQLYATTKSELFSVTLTTGNSPSIAMNRLAGDVNINCPLVKDGKNPTFCENLKLLMVTKNLMYVLSARNTLRSVQLPPVVIPSMLPRPPLPVGFPDESTIMPSIIKSMDSALNTQLSTSETAVGEGSFVVNSNAWYTDFSVLVQQEDYDDQTTKDKVLSTKFTGMETLLREYYNLTDEVVYMDTSIVPFCNSTMLFEMERDVVAVARTALNFPLIYAYPPAAVTINNISNITVMKLLMPATFANGTTTKLLKDANLTNVTVDVIRRLYGPNHTAVLSFPSPPYDFSYLTSEKENDVRWQILDAVHKQLTLCDTLSGSGGGGAVLANVCEPTITNRTVFQTSSQPEITRSDYDVFLPEQYNFDVDQCLDGINWKWLEEYLNKQKPSPRKSESKCNHGCIIGVAVAAAVVIAALIALLVVLTSKRRRLAAVVAPPHPKFKSTLDEEEEELSPSNPLGSNAYGNSTRQD